MVGRLDLVGFHSTGEVTADELPIDLPTTTWRTVLRVVVPVDAGDLLDVSAWMRTTTSVDYPVGVGEHLWAYDVDVPAAEREWWRLDPSGSVGMNIVRDVHHLTLGLELPYVVPATWPPGHRIVVVLRADAHSTAWDRDGNGRADDALAVDPNGRLTVRRFKLAV